VLWWRPQGLIPEPRDHDEAPPDPAGVTPPRPLETAPSDV
jgi:hypothetical protein